MQSEQSLTSSVKEKFELTEDMRKKLTELPQILEFIENLLKYIGKYKKKIKKLKSENKKTPIRKDAAVQTSFQLHCESKPVHSFDEPVESITVDITKAAEQAIQNSGFVYEKTSGMYYDYNTGYYYNAEYGLYYDGNSGTYLQYNQDTKSYEYHSQIHLDAQEPKFPEKIGKRKIKNEVEGKVKTDLDHLANSFNNLKIDRLQNLALGTYLISN